MKWKDYGNEYGISVMHLPVILEAEGTLPAIWMDGRFYLLSLFTQFTLLHALHPQLEQLTTIYTTVSSPVLKLLCCETVSWSTPALDLTECEIIAGLGSAVLF